MIQVTNGGAELVVVRGGVTTTYLYSSFKTISWFQANNGNYIVVVTFLTDAAGNVPLRLSLNDIDNQATWTNNVDGAQQAVQDISSWISLAVLPATGLATEATLLQVLGAVDSMRDYEVRLVVDASDVTWMEVRYWDAQDGTLGTPVYYLAGSTTPGSPALPIKYINPNTYLAQLVTNTTSANRIPGIATLTGSGFTTTGVYSFSIANVGSANGLVGGETISAGTTISFDGGSLNNTLESISYDATGTTFIITYIS